MQACIISPRDPSLCAPLTVGRNMGDCLVANVPLHSLISTELSRAGFDLVEENNITPYTVRLPLDHWIEVGALCILARAQEPTCLHDSTGDLVAWVGADKPENCSEKMVTEAQCFKISYPWHLLQLNEEVLEALPESEILGEVSNLSEVHGTLHLGKGSKILPGVVVEGNVVIGENCKIGPNAYIRGNTSIGNNSIIGNAVEIKNSVLYPHTQVAHLSYIGDSIIGSHTNIGAGTIISNYRHDARNHRCIVNGDLVDTGRQKLGAFIGDGVRTGVHTSIYPGRKIGNGRTTLPGAVIQRDLI